MSRFRQSSSRFAILVVALRREQGGAIAVMLALMLAALVGIAALAVDLGRAWNLHNELQNAADAAALAGATQLDNEAGAIARARLAATTTADPADTGPALAKNQQKFATDAVGRGVAIEAANIKFLETLDPRVYVDESAADADQLANFIEVITNPRTTGFIFSFTGGGAVGGASPDALAVAGMGQAICAVPPMMVCNPDEPLGNTNEFFPFDASAHVGQGLLMKAGGNGGEWDQGNFGLLALNERTLSKNEVRDALGRVHPLALCFGDTVSTNPGQGTAVGQGLNVRFDIYSGIADGLQGNAEYKPSRNPIKGLIKGGAACKLNAAGWTDPLQPYTGPLDPLSAYAGSGSGDIDYADALGFPRDGCAYPAPGGSEACLPVSGGRFGDGEWDVVTYMMVNHNISLAPGTSPTAPPFLGPLAGLDANGDGILTRWEVYQWELETYSSQMPAMDPDAINSNSTEPPAAPMQCYSQPDPGPPDSALGELDRRMLNVAVINCLAEDVKGFTPDVVVVERMELFLTEPMGVGIFKSPPHTNDLYAEVVGPGDQTSFTSIARKIVQLYE